MDSTKCFESIFRSEEKQFWPSFCGRDRTFTSAKVKEVFGSALGGDDTKPGANTK